VLTEDNDNHYHKHPSRRIEKRELRELKEKLDILSSRLIQYEAENEVLQAEKAVLVNEAALSTISSYNNEQQQRQSSSSQPTTRRSWFSTKAGVGDMNNSNNNGGSMQLLVDTNARLMLDNARLEVMVDAIRKSFESHVKDSRRNSAEEKATIKSLLRLSMSERARETYPLENSFVTDSKAPAVEEDCPPPTPNNNINNNNNDASKVDEEASIHREEIILRKSLDSIPEKNKLLFGTLGDDWNIEGEDKDNDDDAMAREERNASCERDFGRDSTLMQSVLVKDDDENNETSTSAVVPVPVADQQQQQHDSIMPASSSKDTTNPAIIEESALISKESTTTTTRRKSLDLLVEFGERERCRSAVIGERRRRTNSSMEDHTSRAIEERRGRYNSLILFNGDAATSCDQEDDVVLTGKTAKSNGSINRRPSGRLRHSLTEGMIVGGRKNENVIVDFPQRKARILWSSLKL